MTHENDPIPNPVEDDDGSWIDSQFFKGILQAGADIIHVDVQRATGKGDNYLSVIFRARVEYRLPESDAVHIKSFISKSFPPGEFMQQYLEEMNIFRREISIYSEILPRMYAFANERLENNSFKKFSANFHKTERPNTIILEDLKPEGFIMASRKDLLDFPHAKLVVKNLARLHALSIASSERHPDLLSEFEEFVFCESNRLRLEQFFQPMLKDITNVVKQWEGFEEIGRKLESLQDIFLNKLMDVAKPVIEFPCVLIHGDCWVNNILFKYSDNGEPVDLRFVDFQMSRKASPAFDLNYFFFSSLRSQVRIHHYHDLLNVYCEEFSSCAKQLGHNKDVCTFEELCREMKRTAPFGFFSAISIMAVVLAEPEDAVDMKEITEEKVESGEIKMFDKTYEKPAFRTIFQDLLPYFDDLGTFN